LSSELERQILCGEKRASGILLHISSLPSKYGIGDFGPDAYRFTEFLVRTRQSYWQVLPLNPSAPVKNNYSPYYSSSAFAGNIFFISPELLYREGFLAGKDVRNRPSFSEARVSYRLVGSYKKKLFDKAYERFEHSTKVSDYERFCEENKSWLEDYATFVALHQHFNGRSWIKWPAELREHKRSALKPVKTKLAYVINREKFLQYVFFKQWRALKNYCNERDIKLIGDISFYVAYESSDVWANPGLFKLTKGRKPRFIAGVPPDLFSRNGQLWNSPVYDWRALGNTGYQWWLGRIRYTLNLFDIVRLDHFRGFVAYWQVPAGHKTAVKGKWVGGPKESFFNTLFKQISPSYFIAEDLGYITSDVRKLIEKFHLAGTKVLLFAFDKNPATNPHCPDNYVKNTVVYTGTHDSNTVKGWFKNEACSKQKRRLFDYTGHKVPAGQVHWEFIRLAMSSVSNTVIIPMQDVLGLGQQARMNKPSTVKDNWRWRLTPHQSNINCEKLAKMTEIYGRC
jgi:4-alpha-glucanotransferase